MKTIEMQKKRLSMHLSADEAARFERVAASYGLNVSATICMLLKREADRLAVLTAQRGGDGQWGRVALRAEAEDASGVVFACPTFFRGAINEAQGGRRAGGYKVAAVTLAGHLAALVEGSEEASAKLRDIVSDSETTIEEVAKLVVDWMRVYLPRCHALVPQAKNAEFTKGIEHAVRNELIQL